MQNYLAGGLNPNVKITNPVFKDGVLENFLIDPSGTEFLKVFLPNAVGLMFVVGIVIFLFMMLLGAISWIASGGEKSAIEGARGKITNAIIGIVLLLSTFALLKIIEVFFGINILTIDIGPLIIQ
ncbi:hypothetical protein A2422_04010 [Candidatus Woesebacteria bacterium RIFOXYC1_FULL_31_51]|uniref:Integral membrane protein n=1 Tax=Candidatus Woesebacteria bacterium GW2011_GWC2_31_9 TaxID=1618586 RepID=A0A0F9Z032_9BACT|nr:MAG: hypothetical protein UR17_C0001G0301 [Candidatus Woesebacteria bacterium GW2011_GWF1_31_35]KKP23205.1 MAG: hypothetical protein UR11_C0001G0179 [Candidatus Woesebacteria bacterium GW2011_GWC1_30_29]KKP26893.1 MAG: hypothetical protein UR13_C0002G0128 [Candidatus Woesebacteria bacterium GW2011_GWD1_31_12]KKP27467.1 MAG: hypothetical protein UR16_C0003G0127 [Candidatus Woesebacteria bacterium GW2011_GWB1_31_29]KKP31125.1 MAG: hypothetical protein UR20_C0043G0008 [Candidatus Woesebacteria 